MGQDILLTPHLRAEDSISSETGPGWRSIFCNGFPVPRDLLTPTFILARCRPTGSGQLGFSRLRVQEALGALVMPEASRQSLHSKPKLAGLSKVMVKPSLEASPSTSVHWTPRPSCRPQPLPPHIVWLPVAG